MTQSPSQLRARSEAEAARLPPLLVRAEQLARTVFLGDHGRRRAGAGDDFWQYRPAQPGDRRKSIDWRRSAKTDGTYVREREWQIAQSVMIWVGQAASMRFSSAGDLPQKGERARLLAMAVAILLTRGGERVGLTGGSLPPRRSDAQILRLAEALSVDRPEDYADPDTRSMPSHSRALFISDFLSDTAPIEAALAKAADQGVRGLMVQVLDPSEASFPFRGRIIFESVGKSLRHETRRANDMRARYLQRLAERKDWLAGMARETGWHHHVHHTDRSAQSALLWIYRTMEDMR